MGLIVVIQFVNINGNNFNPCTFSNSEFHYNRMKYSFDACKRSTCSSFIKSPSIPCNYAILSTCCVFRRNIFIETYYTRIKLKFFRIASLQRSDVRSLLICVSCYNKNQFSNWTITHGIIIFRSIEASLWLIVHISIMNLGHSGKND